jgi:hypothetical protein
VRERIQETERFMRPPTPEELLCLQKVLHRLTKQEATLASLLAAAPQDEVRECCIRYTGKTRPEERAP